MTVPWEHMPGWAVTLCAIILVLTVAAAALMPRFLEFWKYADSRRVPLAQPDEIQGDGPQTDTNAQIY